MSDYVDMTNEEIWDFLKNKMTKNGLKPYQCLTITGDNYPLYTISNGVYYNEADVQKAIVTAYRSGYIRSQKGRPFKIGEKKKKCLDMWVEDDE